MNFVKIISAKKFLVLLWAVGVTSIFALGFVVCGAIADKMNTEKNDLATIILDPGHGGEDGGAVGVDGIVEKDINLSISLKLKDFLQAAGYKVIMTRETDTAIYDDDSKTLREKKRSDLYNRAEIIKDNSQEKAVFVSIHQNKFPNSKYFGSQIFYSKNHAGSQNLASGIKDSLVGLIQPENTREIKPADKKIFLLHNAQIPAVIVECGFLSNQEEADKLTKPEYQTQLAFSIYCGISNYFTNNFADKI
ncbi:MAG: N-acetylmuramoyl-L-alanine amidase CwlD [Acutalibacteraceae bacterium]